MLSQGERVCLTCVEPHPNQRETGENPVKVIAP